MMKGSDGIYETKQVVGSHWLRSGKTERGVADGQKRERVGEMGAD